MWNENIVFNAIIARPKAGVRFEKGNEFLEDLNEAIAQANDEWNGDRMFEILNYDGISLKMAYRSLDAIKGKRTITRHLQKISIILADNMQWNRKVTRKKGTIFHLVDYSIQNDENILKEKNNPSELNEERSLLIIMEQILNELKEIKEYIKHK